MFQSLEKNISVKAFLRITKTQQVKKKWCLISVASLLSRKEQQQYKDNFFLNLFSPLKAVYIKIIVLLQNKKGKPKFLLQIFQL